MMPSILDKKNTSAPSVFLPGGLLREARRQKGLATASVPPVCILDPDGDIVRRLRQTGRSQPFEGWPCYHTELDTFLLGAHEVGIVGRVVGASFAVLVAEELFASGCRLLVSLTSAGQVTPAGPPPYFVVIDRALRDEGTSYIIPHPSLQTQTRHSWRLRRMPWLSWACAAWRVRAGRQMPLSAKRLKRSRRRGPKAFLPSKWKLRRSMLSRAWRTRGCFVWHTSQTPWGSRARTLKRVKQTAHKMLSPFSRRRWPRCISLDFSHVT